MVRKLANILSLRFSQQKVVCLSVGLFDGNDASVSRTRWGYEWSFVGPLEMGTHDVKTTLVFSEI